MDREKYQLSTRYVEKLEELKRDAINDVLLEAANCLTGGLVVVSSSPNSSFIQLENRLELIWKIELLFIKMML